MIAKLDAVLGSTLELSWQCTSIGDSARRLWTLRDLEGKVLRRDAQVPSGSSFAWQIEADYVYRGSQLLAAEPPKAAATSTSITWAPHAW